MADYGKGLCPVCGTTFNKKSTNQIYDTGDCKRDLENLRNRRAGGGPEWPVVQPTKPVTVKPLSVKKKGLSLKEGWESAVILPDIQVGFFKDLNDNLRTTHDEDAISVALQIVQDLQPNTIVMVGDNTDFPELSKYRKYPSFARTTQATIDRCGLLMGELRANAPKAKIVWLQGNHEARLSYYILDNAMAAFGLRRANAPESWPVLSIPELCELDKHGVEYKSGYPANSYFLNKRVRVIHGDIAVKSSTAHRYLSRDGVSTIYGHVHRREMAEKTSLTESGSATILAASPGCLCKIDGTVPGTLSGYDDHGMPLLRTTDWQQGMALVSYAIEDGPFHYEQIPINNGVGFFRGTEYAA